MPLHFGAGGMHGRKGNYRIKARKADLMELYLRSVLFFCPAGT